MIKVGDLVIGIRRRPSNGTLLLNIVAPHDQAIEMLKSDDVRSTIVALDASILASLGEE